MANVKDDYVFKLKGGEASALEYVNPLLERREPIVVFFEDGRANIKIGDGINSYNSLPFISDANISISDVQGLTEILHQYEMAVSTKQDKLTAGDNITIEDNVIDAKVNSKLSYTSKNPIENGKNWNFVNKLAGALANRERGWSDTQLKAISSDVYDVLKEVFNSNEKPLLLNQDDDGVKISDSPYFDVENNKVLSFKPSKITDGNGNFPYDGTGKIMLFANQNDYVEFDFENAAKYDLSNYGYYTGDNTSGKDMFSIDGGILKATSQGDRYSVGALVLQKNGKPIELVAGKHYRISFKYRHNKFQTSNTAWICVTQGANRGSVSNWKGITADSAIMSDDGGYKYATSSADKNHRNYVENGVYVNRITNMSTQWKTYTKDFIAYDVSSSGIDNYLCLTICAGGNHSIEIDDIVVNTPDDIDFLRLDAGTYTIKYSYMMSSSLRDKLVNFKENNTWLERPPFVKFMDNLDENSYKCADPYNSSGEGYNPDAVVVGENICKPMGTFWGNTWYDGEIIFKVPEGRSVTRLDKNGNEIQSGFFGIYVGNLYNDFSIKNIVIEKLSQKAPSTSFINRYVNFSDISTGERTIEIIPSFPNCKKINLTLHVTTNGKGIENLGFRDLNDVEYLQTFEVELENFSNVIFGTVSFTILKDEYSDIAIIDGVVSKTIINDLSRALGSGQFIGIELTFGDISQGIPEGTFYIEEIY